MLVSIVLTLIVVGALLWLVNTYLGRYMAQPILGILNAVVVIVVVIWLLQITGILASIGSVTTPQVR